MTSFFLPLLLMWQAPATEPVVRRDGENLLTVQLPLSILDRGEIHEQLRSGLTNTFLLILTYPAEGGKVQAATRLEIRFELWDEVFLTAIQVDRGGTRRPAPMSPADFRQWWSTAEIPVGGPPIATRTALPEVQLRLAFLPFSRAEQDEARQWLTESADGGREVRGASAGQRQAASIFQSVMATSIKRRPLLEYRWRVRVRDPSARRE